MENWRRHTGEYDFDILCENHTRGLITDTQLFEIWEHQKLLEMDELVSEGVVDVLSQGYQKAKELTGKAKQIYNAAIEKLNNFMLKLYEQAWLLLQKSQKHLSVAIKKITSILNKIKSWCGAHPILCFAAKVMLVSLVVMALSSFFGSDAAHAAIEHKGKILTQVEYDTIQGSMAEHISLLTVPAEIAPGIPGSADFEAIEAVKETQIILKTAFEASDVQTLEQVTTSAGINVQAFENVLEVLQKGMQGDKQSQHTVVNWIEWGRGLTW